MGTMGATVLVLLSAAVLLVADAELSPSFSKLKICDQQSKDKDECNRNAVEMAIRELKDGAEDLGVVQFDPLVIPSLEITHSEGDDSLLLRVTEAAFVGLSASEVSSVRFSLKEHATEIEVVVPSLVLTGKYKISGELAGLAINGHGYSNITMLNVRAKTIYAGDLDKRGCNFFLKIKHFSTKIHPEVMKFQFTNLYDGDDLLENVAIETMNEYHEEVFILLEPSINAAVTRIFRSLFEKVHDKVAYDDLFPEFKIPCP